MNLLLAEDDAILADALTVQLRRSGFEVEHAPNGAVAEYLLLKNSYDIAILDLGLPMVDGLTVLKRLRAARRGLPVLVLTALDSLDDRVSGLNAGADDYLTKPFDFPELQARLHALLRRGRPLAAGQDLAQLNFDRAARRASVQGEALELSPREWLLLDLLLQERDRVVTKEQIVAAWAQDRGENGGGNSVEVYIHRLRRKLEGSGLQIRTVRGLGYLLEADSSAGGAPAAP
ncbi:response regulator transcription factor [Paucibacter sp. DJ2R-2]|jgi:two-component system OmpR family response regulator|uniref:response regulator transcription factor n=1 Tax=unclassified Roseateles TaxID=2626991 RepID=UPI0021E51111|nr:response regulator transcription factor [Paucibacter sp. DJ2R-2]MCV2420495.1 response regulator transcription factor [Paucibacter sp. DJ4R-1]MCV2439673.1 response regulator transcription factor [Paucibacter sp. DJ2R-2]